MMNNLNCIIVGDNEIDQLTVLSFIKQFAQLNIFGAFSNSSDAFLPIQNNQIDILFLDVDRQKLSEVEFLLRTNQVPVCVFITSCHELAVECFELGTLDFILKPLKFERFQHTMRRISDFFEIKNKAELYESSIGGDVIYIKEGREQVKIKLHEILYLEALKDYTFIITPQKRYCVLSSIGLLLKEVSFQSFIRIHRSFAVQKQFIQKINSHEIILNNDLAIPIGRSFRDNLKILH